MPKFEFLDYVKAVLPTEVQITEWKDFVLDDSGRKGLRVTMDATHSGYINDNQKFYIPAVMARGVETLLPSGDKHTKILKHHNKLADPIGVITDAYFVPTIPDDLVNDPDIVTLMSETAQIKDQLKAFQNLYLSGLMNRDDWRGLGFIRIIGDIRDPKTIQQIQDRLFDAVSTYAVPGDGGVYCSVCTQNLIDELCDHINPFMGFGKLNAIDPDDEDSPKVPALPISDTHIYKEVSLVTIEADKFATIKVLDDENADNNKELYLSDDWKSEDSKYGSVTFEFKDSVQEDIMPQKSEINLSDTEQKVFDVIKKLREDAEDEVLIEKAKEIAGLYGEDGTLPNQTEAEIDDETAILYALEDLETKDQEINGDETCDGMKEELAKMKDKGELTEEEFEEADAKLSTEKRKSLPDSAFCGPNRSFPVPDCAHVTAARRLIGRYKGPGNKSSILACVSRKAKALGCNGKDAQEPQEPDTPQVPLMPCAEDSLKDMEDNELRNLYYSAEVELIERGKKVSYECKDCKLHEEKTNKALSQLGEANTEISSLKDTLQILRSELRLTQVEFQDQVDELVKLELELHKAKTDKVALVGVLNNKFDSLDAALEAVNKVGPAGFGAIEDSMTDGFNLEKVVEKLNDGMSGTPDGTVKDPTNNPDKDNPYNWFADLNMNGQRAVEKIKSLISDKKIDYANEFYDRMVMLGVIPEALTFEHISADTVDNPADDN